jgi:hypothetical protein
MRRDPVPLSAKVYLKKAMEGIDAGVKLTDHERLWMLKEAYNHLENAAFAEAENADRLLAALEELSAMCEWLKTNGCLRESSSTEGIPYEPTTEGMILMKARAAIAKAKGK